MYVFVIWFRVYFCYCMIYMPINIHTNVYNMISSSCWLIHSTNSRCAWRLGCGMMACCNRTEARCSCNNISVAVATATQLQQRHVHLGCGSGTGQKGILCVFSGSQRNSTIALRVEISLENLRLWKHFSEYLCLKKNLTMVSTKRHPVASHVWRGHVVQWLSRICDCCWQWSSMKRFNNGIHWNAFFLTMVFTETLFLDNGTHWNAFVDYCIGCFTCLTWLVDTVTDSCVKYDGVSAHICPFLCSIIGWNLLMLENWVGFTWNNFCWEKINTRLHVG